MLHLATESDNQNKSRNLSEQEHFDVVVQNLDRTFQIHNMALFEIVRQVFISCIERGVLMHKVYDFMNNYFDRSMAIMIQERKRSNDRQILVEQYEKMIHKFHSDKEESRDQVWLNFHFLNTISRCTC
jgi:hypothetical protein